jgi:predicted nucleic acid-binding protein
MIVISDTSPLNYLVQIGLVDLLPALYQAIVVPTAVASELRDGGAPTPVRAFMAAPPPWLTVRPVSSVDPSIGLGRGENEAISLALEIGADRILVDDRVARRAARDRGLSAVGTLTVLDNAAERNLVSFPQAVGRLRTTNFRMPEAVVAELLRRDSARRGLR